MCPELVAAAQAVRDSDWHTFGADADGTVRQTAELDYVPALPSEHKNARPRRYIGLRLLKPQDAARGTNRLWNRRCALKCGANRASESPASLCRPAIA